VSTHYCPKSGCTKLVPRARFACATHWFQLPKDVRDGIWKAYYDHGLGSDELMAAHNRAYSAWGDA
jgi:hypothetical protein